MARQRAIPRQKWRIADRILPTCLVLAILFLFCVEAFGVNNSVFDIYVMAAFAAVGYLATKLGFEPTLMIIGYVPGPPMEEYLRRSLLLSRGDWLIFIERPISLAFLTIAGLLLLLTVLPTIRKRRGLVFGAE